MRGSDASFGIAVSYVDLEGRVPSKHPLQVIKGIVEDVLVSLETACSTPMWRGESILDAMRPRC
jgi:hypothetical protein